MTPTFSHFEFATSQRIIFGAGTIARIGVESAALGKNALLVCGKDVSRAEKVRKLLLDAGLSTTVLSISGEPVLQNLLDGLALLHRSAIDLVIGFGGGAALDTAKALAILATNDGNPLEYLETVGSGKALTNASLPVICIPTTAGTGSEVTKNAVIGIPDHKIKVSLRSSLMLPRLALVDPELTWSLPPNQTAWSGLDALTQLAEAFVSNKSNPITDALCRDGLQRAVRALRPAWISACNHEDDSPETLSLSSAEAHAREDMALASLMGGLVLANARLGAVHGFAGPLGGRLMAPHGAICALLHPLVLETNYQTLCKLQSDQSEKINRLHELANLLNGGSNPKIENAVSNLRAMNHEFNIPDLGHWGFSSDDIPQIVAEARPTGSMQGNPIQLDDHELERILQLASRPSL